MSLGPWNYQPVGGGLLEALTRVGQGLAQGLLTRQQLDVEQQEREAIRQDRERRRKLERLQFLTDEAQRLIGAKQKPSALLMTELNTLREEVFGPGAALPTRTTPGEIIQPAKPAVMGQVPVGPRASRVPMVTEPGEISAAVPEVRGPERTEMFIPGMEPSALRTVGDLGTNLGLNIRKGVNPELLLSDLPKNFDLGSLFEGDEQMIELTTPEGKTIKVTRAEMVELMKSPEFMGRVYGPSPQKQLETSQARATKLRSELDNKLEAIRQAYLSNKHLLNTLIATYNKRLKEMQKHVPEVAAAYSVIGPAQATQMIRETEAAQRMNEEEKQSLIESRRNAGRVSSQQRTVEAEAYFNRLVSTGISEQQALFRTKLKYPDVYGQPSSEAPGGVDLQQAKREFAQAQSRYRQVAAEVQALRSELHKTRSGRQVGPFRVGKPEGDPKLAEKLREKIADLAAAEAAAKFWHQEVDRLSRQPSPQPSRATQPPVAPASGFDQLPDPKQYAGQTIVDTQTGRKYRSDGTKWVEVK